MNVKRAVPVLLLLLLAGAAVWTLTRRTGAPDGELRASGTVEATAADLGFQLPGRLDDVAVREGDRVLAGDELAWLDVGELEARRAAAEAQLAAARAQLLELERGARAEERAQARSALEAAEQRLEDARRDLERTRNLERGGAVSREALDKAATAFELARALRDQSGEQLALVESGARPERVDVQRAMVLQAEAAVRQVDALLGNARVRAPFPGVVTVRHREPGETVAAGLPVLTVMNPDDRWVRIYVPEDRLGLLALGQAARITSGSHPGREYEGRVTFISGEAEFTPRNVQTEAERAKLVYAVKVAVTGDGAYDLKVGTPADVRLVGVPSEPRAAAR